MAQYGMSGALPIPAPTMIAALTAMTLVGSPLVNLIPSLGEETGLARIPAAGFGAAGKGQSRPAVRHDLGAVAHPP